MAGLSAAGEVTVLASITGGSVYVSLHTSDPGLTGILGEVSGNNYQRVGPVSFTNTGAGNPTVAQNNSVQTFLQATPSGWGTISWFGLWTALTGGTFIGSASMASKTVNANDTARFAVSALSISVD